MAVLLVSEDKAVFCIVVVSGSENNENVGSS